jgi:DNA sulfur modification protein DndD
MPYNDIRIRNIDHCLNLEGQEGGSVGETLCVAYAFLSTLFAKTRHELPFVVDSPAGAIDLRVREQVAELVPKLSSQFVAFVISAEREGFLDSLERSVDSNIQYITLFRSEVENAGISLNGADQLIESSDGNTVLGRHFFRGFHVDTED